MKTLTSRMKISVLGLLLLAVQMLNGTAAVAGMYDYCVVPPFIQEIAKPNLLMIIDNSASMYDLAYVDRGKKHCSATTTRGCFLDTDCNHCSATTAQACLANKDCPTSETCVIVTPNHCSVSTAQYCSTNSECPTAETCVLTGERCSAFDRQPFYCYDQTYRSGNTYVGYFNRLQSDNTKQYYNYDFTVPLTLMTGSTTVYERNGKFNPVTTFSCAGSGAATEVVKQVANELCLIYNTSLPATDQVTKFLASGNYLNWMTTS